MMYFECVLQLTQKVSVNEFLIKAILARRKNGIKSIGKAGPDGVGAVGAAVSNKLYLSEPCQQASARQMHIECINTL